MIKFYLKLACLLLIAGKGYGYCLDFETAWARVINGAPSLSVAELEIDARTAEATQVGLFQNPVLEVEAENIGVSHPSRNTEPPQTTISLSQLLELGGKRRARWAVAACETDIAFWDAQIAMQDRRLQLITAFIAVSASQEKYQLAQKKKQVGEQFHECVVTQCQNGKASPIQEKKALIAFKAACINEREAWGRFEEAKKQLSLMWGCPCPDFDGVAFDFYLFSQPPCQEELLEGLYCTPDYVRAQQGLCCASRVLNLEKINSIPDVVVTVGCRVYNDANAYGWVVGAQMPIPFFNYNQGNIQRACIKYGQAGYQMDELVRGLQEVISVAHEHLLVAYDTSVMICKGVLSDALEAFDLTQDGYRSGKFDYMELLDAQQMLFEIQEKYIDVLSDYHLHRAELARLSGEFND